MDKITLIILIVFLLLAIANVAISVWQIFDVTDHAEDYTVDKLIRITKSHDVLIIVWTIALSVLFILYCTNDGRPIA